MTHCDNESVDHQVNSLAEESKWRISPGDPEKRVSSSESQTSRDFGFQGSFSEIRYSSRLNLI